MCNGAVNHRCSNETQSSIVFEGGVDEPTIIADVCYLLLNTIIRNQMSAG